MTLLHISSLDLTKAVGEALPVGPVLLLFSAACFGTTGVFGKLAYQAGVSPDALLLLRFTLAAALLTIPLVLRSGTGVRTTIPVRSTASGAGRTRWGLLLTALGLGALGYATPAMLFFTALTRIDATLVTLILYTYPVFVTVAAALLGRDRLTPGRCAALVVASCGTLLVLVGAGAVGFDSFAVALAFGAALSYTGYVLVADTVVHRLHPVVLSVMVMTGASLALAVRTLAAGGIDLDFDGAGWLWAACLAGVSTVVGMFAFLAGLRRTGPATAAILSTFEPVVTAGLAALTLGEFLTPLQFVGGLLVLSAVAVLQLRPRKARGARPTEQVEALAGRATAS
jgi:drug/metabolite transporter (DMT)-like permease